MNKIYQYIIAEIIHIVDLINKRKVINFFKSKFKNNKIKVIDIGAHKGETLEIFYKNFNLEKIFCFEPNQELFEILKKKKKKYLEDVIEIFNYGVGQKNETKELNIFQDSSSSSFNNLNEDTDYYKRKKKILSFFSKKDSFLKKRQSIKIINLSNFICENKINNIDVLKIDTEGYEFNILKGLEEKDLNNIKYIFFEHHYDLMLNKGYSFSDIDKLLKTNQFIKVKKFRMKFRKSFEYIYHNKNFRL
jgi:FkbM family methyltransferase